MANRIRQVDEKVKSIKAARKQINVEQAAGEAELFSLPPSLNLVEVETLPS